MRYPIEHYKTLLVENPKWLGEQARDILEYVDILETRIEVLEEELRRTKLAGWGEQLPLWEIEKRRQE